MATPSSSATTPSPPMAYLQAQNAPQGAMHTVSSVNVAPNSSPHSQEEEAKRLAVQKVLARAHMSEVGLNYRRRPEV